MTPWTAAHQSSLSFIISWSLLKLMSIESVMLSNHLILFCPRLLMPQSFPASGSFPMSWLFTSGGQSIGASVSASSECSGLISFRIDWFDFLAVQGTLKSLLQHPSSKASISDAQTSLWSNFTPVYDHWKNHSFDHVDTVVRIRF